MEPATPKNPPLRAVGAHRSVGTPQQWFSMVREMAAFPAEETAWLRALTAMEAKLSELHAKDSEQYSGIFEPSVQWAPGLISTYRFSYSWPHFKARKSDACRALLSLVRPFGEAMSRRFAHCLGLANCPAVEQLLFGIDAASSPVKSRLKLYFQFSCGYGREKTDFLSRLGLTGLPGQLADRLPSLQLAGIDFTSGGICGMKLYLLHPRLRLDHLNPPFARNPLLSHLRSLGVAMLADVLSIIRLERPGEGAAYEPAEIDFSLRDNRLAWPDIKTYLSSRQLPFAPLPYEPLRNGLNTRETRISVPVQRDDRMNLYYVLSGR